MAVVNIPNVGSVNFPDSMSQADIINAIENDILPNYAGAAAAPQNAVQTPVAAAPAVTAPTPVTETPTPEEYYDPMTGAPVGNISSATPQKTPKLPGSVMAGVNENLPPTQTPQIDPAVKNIYDAASQEERVKLAKSDIRFAEVAKYYRDLDIKNKEYLETNPSGAINPYMADDRLEYRVRDYIRQGMSPEVALNTAKQDALEGKPSHVSTAGEVKEAPEEYMLKRGYALDPKAPGYETALKLAQRTALKSLYGFAQAGGGQQKFLAEAILGIDPSDTNKTLDYLSKHTEALGDPTSKPLALVENAVSSIIQQLPGLLTGTEALSLGSMFLQSFGQTYDDSRRKNLGIGESTFRSAAYGALEVLGEKLGLGDTLKGIKAASRGIPDKELIEHFAKSLAKEIPGEQLTYAGQFGIDKAFALNPEAGIKQFLNGAVDTLAATVAQGGIMMGGAAAINKANQVYSDAAGTRRAEDAAETAKQNALQKAQDMFKFTPKQKGETVEQLTSVTPPEQPEEVKPLSDQGVIWLEPTEQTATEPYIDPETGEVMEKRPEPKIGSGGNEAVIQRRAAEIASELGVPKNIALAMAQREASERGQNVERAPAKPDTGRVEPSISVLESEAPAAEVTTPPDTTGLAGPVETPEPSVAGKGEEPAALGEIPTLTERPPAAEETPKTEKEQLQALLAYDENRLATLPKTTANNGERFHLEASIKDIKEKLAAQEPTAETVTAKEPTAETPATPVEQAQTKLADAETAVAEATTPEEKTEATKQRNVARQELKKAEAAAPVEKTLAATTTTEVAKPKRGRPPKPKAEVTTPVAQENKPKRGRKPNPPLPPDLQAAADKTRKKNQEKAIYAGRDVDKLIKFLSTEFDPANHKSPEFTKVATQGLQNVRREYIYKLNEFANKHRGKPNSGGKAKDFLANSDKITLKERSDLAERLQFEKSRRPSPAQTKSAGTPVPAFYKFTTATQAINHIIRNGTPFERALAARLKPFVSDVRLIIAKDEDSTHPAIAEMIEDPENDVSASGVYSSVQFGDKFHRNIVLRGENFGDDPGQQGVNNIIFLHEALHAATEAKIDQWQTLTNAGKPVPPELKKVIDELFGTMADAQVQYEKMKASGEFISVNLRHKFESKENNGLDILNDLKEFVAYGMTDPEIQQFLLDTPGAVRKDAATGFWKNLFNRFVNNLRKMFDMDDKHQSALQDLILITEGILQEQEFEPAYSANTELNASVAKADKNLTKIAASNNQQDVIDGIQGNVPTHDFGLYDKLMKSRFPAMGSGFISKSLGKLQTSDIIRWQGDNIPALKRIDELVERMVGSRMNMEKAFAKKADKLAKFMRYSRRSSRQALSDAMHLARLESVSPTEFSDRQDALANDLRVVELTKLANDPRTNPDELNAIDDKIKKREASINKVFDAWERLGQVKDGQEMYRMVRKFYKDMNVLHRTLLDERIDRLNLSGAVNDPTTPKGKLMLSVRRMFEGSDYAGVDEYFPFMRHGEYWLRVNGPEGREFYMFDNGSKRNDFLHIRAAQLGLDVKDPKAFDAGDTSNELRNKYSGESKILAEMFDVINQHFDNTKIPNAANMSEAELKNAQETQAQALEQLKDSLYQTYLMTMPEQSYRKQFLHAENVTGFSSDVFRNFKMSATKLASQASKLAYSDLINMEVQSGYDSLEGMPALERAKMRLFVDEVGFRANAEINPQEDNIYATGLNQLGYFWMLSGVATAITQTTSIPIMVMPILNDEYGYGKSAAKFTKYMQLWKSVGVTENGPNGDTNWFAPSMGTSKLVQRDPILKRAFAEASERGILSQTSISVLTNRNRTPANAYSNIPSAFLRATKIGMSALFNGAERMTREMTYMMTFELEYAKTKDFDKSVQKAIDVVQETLGRYDNFNRPRILRNVLGRTVGQFKMYAVNMTSFFMRNGYNIFKGMYEGITIGKADLLLSSMHRLGGVLTMAALFGGITALPLYTTVCAVIDMYIDFFGDDEEKKRRIARNPYTAESADLRFRYEFLPEWFGPMRYQTTKGLDGREHTLASILEKGAVSELTDINVGSRTSFDGMWWRGGKHGDTEREKVENFLIANLGAGAETILKIPEAMTEWRNGNILRGFEKILPAMLKNVVTEERLRREGAKTPSGKLIMSKEEFSSFSLAMQSLGFQSTALARVQENGIKLQEEIVLAAEQRANILKRLGTTMLSEDATDKDVERVFNKIDEYNDRYVALKHLRIDPNTIKEVVDRAKGKEKYMFRGMYIRKEDLPYLLELRDVAEPGQRK